MGSERADEQSRSLRGARPRILLVFSILGLAGLTHPARSAVPDRFALQIPALDLAQSLQELCRQSGVQIIFFSTIAEGHRGIALDGRYTVSEALTTLLAESKLAFRSLNPQTYQILPAGSPQPSGRHPRVPPRRA